MRRVIRTDGTEEPLPNPVSFAELHRLIGATVMDTVNLTHLGEPLQVMLVDDMGYETQPVTTGNTMELVPVRALKPVNEKATALYHANCAPGTTHKIVGDVVIIFEADPE